MNRINSKNDTSKQNSKLSLQSIDHLIFQLQPTIISPFNSLYFNWQSSAQGNSCMNRQHSYIIRNTWEGSVDDDDGDVCSGLYFNLPPYSFSCQVAHSVVHTQQLKYIFFALANLLLSIIHLNTHIVQQRFEV